MIIHLLRFLRSGATVVGGVRIKFFRTRIALSHGVDPVEFDYRRLPPFKKVGSLRKKALARFLERARRDTASVRIEASFHVGGDALELVRVGVLSADTEIVHGAVKDGHRWPTKVDDEGAVVAWETCTLYGLLGRTATVMWPANPAPEVTGA